jgi:hypothetical protein
MAADSHSSTAPLLRQLRALQDEGRHRQQAWASAEATLLERCTQAEEKAEAALKLKADAEVYFLFNCNASPLMSYKDHT